MATANYTEFLRSKLLIVPNAGKEVSEEQINPNLFPFQKVLTRYALRKGRSACWATTGLGKSRIALAFAEHAADRVLMLCPLAVASQMVREGEKIGVPVTYARRQDHAAAVGVTVTNYEMMDHFDADAFGAVILDESSILKAQDGKTKARLIEKFRDTPYKLCLTATPAPNDREELANHAEFLGVMSRPEFLAHWFVHDDAGWRLKKHGQTAFYRWLASWGMSLNKPSDLGFSDDGYDLPPLTIEPHFVETDYTPEGRLFALDLKGVTERASVRRGTLKARCMAALEIIKSSSLEVNSQPIDVKILVCGNQNTKITGNENGNLTPSMMPRSEAEEVELLKKIAPICSDTIRRTKSDGDNIARNIERSETPSDESDMPLTQSSERSGRKPQENATSRSSETAGCEANSGLGLLNTIFSLSSKGEDVQSVDQSSLTETAGDLPLTTVISQELSEDCSVVIATRESVSSKTTPNSCAWPHPTSNVTEPWIVWVGLDDEQRLLEKQLGGLSISVYGSLPPDEKERRILSWLDGEAPILITKPSVAGFGLNLQHCARMLFVGLGDSFEQYFQCIRRCYRFGQTRPVKVRIILSEPERPIYENVIRKEREAERMSRELIAHVSEFEQEEIRQVSPKIDYQPGHKMELPRWLGGAVRL